MESSGVSDTMIDSKEDFYKILKDMYCIEECFEGMHSWVGGIISDEKYSKLLVELADDSNEHRKQLEGLIDKIDEIEPKETDVESFDFEAGMDDEAILKKVLENDHTALYNYSLLKNKVKQELLESVFSEEDIQAYHEALENIIKDELKHITMLRTELDRIK